MEELAMLRQFIAQAQELSELYGYDISPYNLRLQPHNQLPQPSLLYDRWCFAKQYNGTSDDSDLSFIIQNPKPATLEMLEPWKPSPSKKTRKERSKEISQIITSSTNVMDPEIWTEFPDDLFEAVVARLPPASFFRFRSVCQKWNSLLNSHSFSQPYAQVRPTLPWFYIVTIDPLVSGALYDPYSKKWYHPPQKWYHPPLLLLQKMVTLPLASAGGLICLMDIANETFNLFNPLSGFLKKLPARSPNWTPIAVGMTLNGKSTKEGYKILWLSCDGDYGVFDSIKNSWDKPGTIPSSVKLPLSLNFSLHTVSLDGCVYFMRTDPDGILSYDMTGGAWKEFLTPYPNEQLRDGALAECGGRIMFVGLLTKNAVTCVCVWELQKMTLLWKEVDRMPNKWCLNFYGKHLKMTCLGNKGLLLLWLTSTHVNQHVNQLVTYDIMKREWSKHGRMRHCIAYGTAFHPSITATA